MEFSKEIGRFTISEAAQHQLEIIYLTEIVRDDLFPQLPELAEKKLVESYEVLKPNFNSDQEYEEYVESEMNQTLDSFDKAIWSSLFTYSYFNLERDLNTLCKKIENEIGSKITLGNLNGKGINRAKLFLKKLAKVDFGVVSEEWEEIIMLKEIRNCISHNANSIVKSNKQDQIEEFVEKHNGIDVEDKVIIISPNFIIESCYLTYEFWLKIGYQLIPEDSEWT